MTVQLTPVALENFSGKNWRRNADFAFAAGRNLEMIVFAELARATTSLPLAFVESPNGFQLAAVLGLRSGSNVFIGPNGRWLGPYVPAALRSHPFHVATAPGKADQIFCFDVSSGLLCDAGQGEEFFTAEGKLSPNTLQAFEFLSQLESSRKATHTAVASLVKAGVIKPWEFEWTDAQGKKTAVRGLFRADDAVMATLPSEDFLALRQSHGLTVAYAQLFSMSLMPALIQIAQAASRTPTVDPNKLKGMTMSTEGGVFSFD